MGQRAYFLRDADPERQQELHWLDLQCSPAYTYVTTWDHDCEKRVHEVEKKSRQEKWEGSEWEMD